MVQAQGQQPPPTTRPSQTPPAVAMPTQPTPTAQTPRPAPPAGEVPVQPVPGGQSARQTPPSAATMPAPQQSVWQNIKLDITITDAASATTQLRKVLSLYIADGRQGQVRSQSEQGLINIDARPQVRPDGKTILMQLTVEYRQGVSGSTFSESLAAMVVDGKPIVLSQTADPNGDRKVSVEVLATIQKN
jgi:hypothetical protein